MYLIVLKYLLHTNLGDFLLLLPIIRMVSGNWKKVAVLMQQQEVLNSISKDMEQNNI